MPGSTVSLQLLRNGHSESVSAKLGELDAANGKAPDRSDSRAEGGRFGMSVEPVTPDIAAEAGLPRGTQGLLVGDVDPSGIAAESQVQSGDVITKVDGHAVTTVDGLKSALDRKDGKPSLLVVNRKGATIFLTMRSE